MSLIVVCGIAFALVLTLLTLLAGMIQLIGWIFPESNAETDPAVVACIHNAVSAMIPGAKVTRIVETKQ